MALVWALSQGLSGDVSDEARSSPEPRTETHYHASALPVRIASDSTERYGVVKHATTLVAHRLHRLRDCFHTFNRLWSSSQLHLSDPSANLTSLATSCTDACTASPLALALRTRYGAARLDPPASCAALQFTQLQTCMSGALQWQDPASRPPGQDSWPSCSVRCAPGCDPAMQGDGVPHPQCNTAACCYDQGDFHTSLLTAINTALRQLLLPGGPLAQSGSASLARTCALQAVYNAEPGYGDSRQRSLLAVACRLAQLVAQGADVTGSALSPPPVTAPVMSALQPWEELSGALGAAGAAVAGLEARALRLMAALNTSAWLLTYQVPSRPDARAVAAALPQSQWPELGPMAQEAAVDLRAALDSQPAEDAADSVGAAALPAAALLAAQSAAACLTAASAASALLGGADGAGGVAAQPLVMEALLVGPTLLVVQQGGRLADPLASTSLDLALEWADGQLVQAMAAPGALLPQVPPAATLVRVFVYGALLRLLFSTGSSGSGSEGVLAVEVSAVRHRGLQLLIRGAGDRLLLQGPSPAALWTSQLATSPARLAAQSALQRSLAAQFRAGGRGWDTDGDGSVSAEEFWSMLLQSGQVLPVGAAAWQLWSAAVAPNSPRRSTGFRGALLTASNPLVASALGAVQRLLSRSLGSTPGLTPAAWSSLAALQGWDTDADGQVDQPQPLVTPPLAPLPAPRPLPAPPVPPAPPAPPSSWAAWLPHLDAVALELMPGSSSRSALAARLASDCYQLLGADSLAAVALAPHLVMLGAELAGKVAGASSNSSLGPGLAAALTALSTGPGLAAAGLGADTLALMQPGINRLAPHPPGPGPAGRRQLSAPAPPLPASGPGPPDVASLAQHYLRAVAQPLPALQLGYLAAALTVPPVVALGAVMGAVADLDQHASGSRLLPSFTSALLQLAGPSYSQGAAGGLQAAWAFRSAADGLSAALQSLSGLQQLVALQDTAAALRSPDLTWCPGRGAARLDQLDSAELLAYTTSRLLPALAQSRELALATALRTFNRYSAQYQQATLQPPRASALLASGLPPYAPPSPLTPPATFTATSSWLQGLAAATAAELAAAPSTSSLPVTTVAVTLRSAGWAAAFAQLASTGSATFQVPLPSTTNYWGVGQRSTSAAAWPSAEAAASQQAPPASTAHLAVPPSTSTFTPSNCSAPLNADHDRLASAWPTAQWRRCVSSWTSLPAEQWGALGGSRFSNVPGGQPLPLLGLADFEVLWPGQEAVGRCQRLPSGNYRARLTVLNGAASSQPLTYALVPGQPQQLLDHTGPLAWPPPPTAPPPPFTAGTAQVQGGLTLQGMALAQFSSPLRLAFRQVVAAAGLNATGRTDHAIITSAVDSPSAPGRRLALTHSTPQGPTALQPARRRPLQDGGAPPAVSVGFQLVRLTDSSQAAQAAARIVSGAASGLLLRALQDQGLPASGLLLDSITFLNVSSAPPPPPPPTQPPPQPPGPAPQMSRTVEVVVIVVAALSLAVVAGLLAALTVLLMRRHNQKVAPSPSGPTAPNPLLPALTPPAAEAPSSPAGKGSPLLSAGRAAQGPLSDFDAIASLERAASPWALHTPRLPAGRLPPLYYTPGSLLHGPQLAGQEGPCCRALHSGCKHTGQDVNARGAGVLRQRECQ
ncbi:hypothetical protein V8C86DRAFT_3030131 [Haematococcus lacustris]